MLPVQASPALLQAYREVIRALITRLVANGCDSAPAVAEHVRVQLLPEHDVLADFVSDGRVVRDPVVAPPELGAAMAAWTRDVLWATGAGRETPEQLLAELGRERRHLLQSTGFWDALPWRVTW
jgi:hypothetical protein